MGDITFGDGASLEAGGDLIVAGRDVTIEAPAGWQEQVQGAMDEHVKNPIAYQHVAGAIEEIQEELAGEQDRGRLEVLMDFLATVAPPVATTLGRLIPLLLQK